MMGRSRSGCGQGPAARRPGRRPRVAIVPGRPPGVFGATARFAEIGRAASLHYALGHLFSSERSAKLRPRSFRTCQSTPIPPQRTPLRCPSPRACPHELGPAAQRTSVRWSIWNSARHCGGTLKIIAAIEHPPVITKILQRISAVAPPEHRPRSPAARGFFRTS